MSATGDIRLTELTSCGGCAAKYSAALLQELVGRLPLDSDPNLLVGLAPADDAAVYRLDDERALVFTVDFFPPIVDDPARLRRDRRDERAQRRVRDGRQAAARAVDCRVPRVAAGATPSRRSSKAAADKVREAGGVLAGGHTLRDEEPLYGLAVVGTVAPNAIWTKAGAQPGDQLYLSKPLGTGLLVHARKEGRIDDATLAPTVELMKTLNAAAADILRTVEPHAVTDVTGFGLLGHAYELATRSGVRVELDARLLPVIPGGDRARRPRRRHRRRSPQPRVRRRRAHGRRRLRHPSQPGLRPADGRRVALCDPARAGACVRAGLRRAKHAPEPDRLGQRRCGSATVRLIRVNRARVWLALPSVRAACSSPGTRADGRARSCP